MADRLKDIYSTNFLINFGNKITRVYPDFKSAEFLAAVLDDTWEELSVRARSKQIATQLGCFLHPITRRR